MFEINVGTQRSTYDPVMVQPFRDEVTRVGVKELLTAEEVDNVVAMPGTTLVFVNSVCGCAAGMARPALGFIMQNGVLPDRVVSVFAGMEKDAVAKARNYFAPYPPSSPSFGMIKDGKLVAILERKNIEGRSAQMVAMDLLTMIETHCEQKVRS